MEDAPKLLKFQNRNVQTLGFVYHDTNGLNRGPVWKVQSFLWSEICTVILMGKAIRESSSTVRLGKSSELECFFVVREKRLFLTVYVVDFKLAGKKQNIKPPWTILMKDVEWGWTDILSWPCLSGLHWKENVRFARILLIITEVCSNQGFLQGLQKKCQKQKPRWNLMPKQYLYGHMEGHGKKCVERCCELTNKTTAIFQSRNAMHGWPSVYTNCSEMPKLGTYWFTWCPMVREQTCSCSYKMDKGMWQTFGAFHLLHSSHMWVQATLLCGKHSTTVQNRIFSRLWFCRRPWRLEIDIRWNTVHFGRRTFGPICCMCKNQTEVSHSSTEAEVLSFDAGLRMDGIPARDLWDSFLTKPKTLESRRETCRQISI